MNTKTFARLLDGREYGSEITDKEDELARQLGMVIVFGASDDLLEFRGAISDELGCYGGGKVYINPSSWSTEISGLVPPSETANYKIIDVKWCQSCYSWFIEINIPHESFDVLENGEKFCRGIIFSINDLNTQKNCRCDMNEKICPVSKAICSEKCGCEEFLEGGVPVR